MTFDLIDEQKAVLARPAREASQATPTTGDER